MGICTQQLSNVALVILDLMMPQLGGKTCHEELPKINQQVKVIFSTKYSMDAAQNNRL
jgi:CheY-like chemotaxis protein